MLAQAPTTKPTLPDIPHRKPLTTDGVGYETGYAYNLSGAMVEQRYPSGRVVKNVLDASGDLSMVQSARCMDAAAGTGAECTAQAGLWNYGRHFTYNAAGAVTSMQLGNGRWESTVFNSRLQPVQIALGSTGTAAQAHDLLKLDYGYGGANNNGNVLSQTITVPSVTIGGTTHSGFTAVQNYNYDSLNRLKQATENITPNGGTQTQSWQQTFTFDRYGNRNFDEANTTFTGFDKLCNNNTELCAELRKILNPSVNPSDNRLSPSDDYAFDTSGNTTEDAEGRTFIYDGENKQVEVRDAQQNIIGQYRYDGDGKRIKKHVPSTGEVTVFVYDAAGKSIAEYSTQISQDPKVSYTTSDHLGSPRILTDENGTVTSRRDFHPFGEEITTSERTTELGYQPDSVRRKFTSYERDNETDLDFAQARYLVVSLGRFSSIDPAFESMDVTLPQSWNRYSYTLNNPILYIDPDGELWILNTGDDKDKNPYTWVDKCGEGQRCWTAVAHNTGTAVVVYGSFGSWDRTTYNANEHGQIHMEGILNHHDSNVLSVAMFQGIPEPWLSTRAAEALFNAGIVYKEMYPNDDKLVFTNGNAANGKPCTKANGSPCHGGHQGNDIDMRYMSSKGTALVGKGAYKSADVDRTKFLISWFNRVGFPESYSGNTRKFGSSSAGPGTEEVHYDHLHIGIVDPKPAAQPRKKDNNRKKL